MNDETPLPGGAERLEARARFLAEFLGAWLEGGDLATLVGESARKLRAILDVDRLTISFLREVEGETRLVARATDSAPGVPPLPPGLRLVPTHGPLWEKTSRTFWTEDVLQDPELACLESEFRAAGTRAMLLVPIRISKKHRGAVVATTLRHHPRRFRPGEAAFLETAVGYLAAALRDAELLEQLSRERDRQRVLFDVAMAVQRTSTVPELVETVLQALKDSLGFPIGLFGLLAPDGRSLEPSGGYGGTLAAGRAQPNVVFTGSGPPTLAEQAMAAEEPILVEDIATDPRAEASRERLLGLGARGVAMVGLRVTGRPLGILCVGTSDEPRRLEPEDVRTLRSLAGLVSVALDQRRAAEVAERATREARTLSEATRALLTRTASLDVLLQQVLDALVLHFKKDNCRLLLVDAGKQTLSMFARRGDWSGAMQEEAFPLSGPGLTTAAAREGVVVNVADVATDERYVDGWPSARSELVVPLRVDDEVQGVIDLQSPRLAAFGPDDVRVLSEFADRVALAIRLSGLVKALEARTRVLEAVTRATRLLNFRLQAPDVLTALVEETSRAFPSADGCAVLVADDEGKRLKVAATFGVGRALKGLTQDVPQPVSTFPCLGVAFAEDRPVFLSISGVDELLASRSVDVRARVHAALAGPDIHHLLAVPIRVGERRLGVLEVMASGERPFDAGEAETLSLLADHAAIALRNARTVEELQRSNRLKDDFLANLSHEVRTPLTGIVGWSEVLLDARGDDPETRRALLAILGQADGLSRMLADLIDLSRIDNFGLELRRDPVILAEVTRAALDAVSPGAVKKNVVIECDVPETLPRIEGDQARLKQVVLNLLSNAVKFSPSNGVVKVEGCVTPAGDVALSVEDRGSGIDPAFLPFVFDRFRQEETSFNRRFGGLGVGLAIVRAIVQAHDGTIEVTSQGRDKGCRFFVRFPRERARHPSGAFLAARTGDETGR